MQSKKGFTLIELLVVVMIIGILAAIAIPQYQKAAEKAEATQALTLLKTFAQAADAYYMANGRYPIDFEELDVALPADWNGTENYYPHPSNPQDARSNGKWSIVLEDAQSANNSWVLWIGRLKGKYAGGGFGYLALQNDANANPNHQIICTEVVRYGPPLQPAGIFCEKLFNATLHSLTGQRIYILP